MKQQQLHQAQRLFFQTDLTKTQIAETLGISRRTVYYWVQENNWERLKRSAAVMPALLSENCYHIMGQLTEHILSPERSTQPVTREEVDNIHKLAITINKLRARTSLNESMEVFAGFMDGLSANDPALAKQLEPHVDNYIASRASSSTSLTREERPIAGYTATARDSRSDVELQLDLEDELALSTEQGIKDLESALFATPASETKSASTPPASSPKAIHKSIREQLKGTATSGPGKTVYHRQAATNTAA